MGEPINNPFDELIALRARLAELERAEAERRRAEEERDRTLARERAARAEAEAAQRRLAFLAEASAALASTLNEEVTLHSVACLAVPYLADWCVVDLLREDGSVQRCAGRHSDPARDALLYELLTHSPFDCRPDGPACVPWVMRTGKPEVVNDVPDGLLDGAAAGPEHARVLRGLGIGSYMIVPLVARQRTLGAISFVAARPGRYGPNDLVLGEDLARRAALAVDHARLYQQARDSDRRKDEFLAMLSHELRNPLAPIRNTLAVLRARGPAGAWDGQAHELIERQVHTLARLVDDLLDVSRVTRGKIALHKECVDLRVLARQAVETSRPLIEARRHELTVALPEAPLLLEADPTRLEQVLTNLLNNAAKYTEAGGRILLEVERAGDDAVVRVRDNGIGMRPEVLAQAFDLFAQGDRALARAEGGLGIGLTMVRSLVQMHGGTVTAYSDGPGKGSEFLVRLPALPDEAPAALAPPGQTEPARPCRLLVVDDNRDAADSLAMLLRLAGHTVQVVYEGRAALEAATASPPEVVLLDIGLPGMDGYEVARQLRAQGATEKTVLIAISGYGQEEDRTRSRAAGFDHHLVKPVEPAAVETLLAEYAAARAVPEIGL